MDDPAPKGLSIKTKNNSVRRKRRPCMGQLRIERSAVTIVATGSRRPAQVFVGRPVVARAALGRFFSQRNSPQLIVCGAAIQCLKVIPGQRHPRGEDRAPGAWIEVRMQPPEEKGHVASELCACRFWTRAKDAVAVGIRRQQDLLDEKSNRLTDHVTGSARKLDRLAYRLFIANRDSKQLQNAHRQR